MSLYSANRDETVKSEQMTEHIRLIFIVENLGRRRYNYVWCALFRRRNPQNIEPVVLSSDATVKNGTDVEELISTIPTSQPFSR